MSTTHPSIGAALKEYLEATGEQETPLVTKRRPCYVIQRREPLSSDNMEPDTETLKVVDSREEAQKFIDEMSEKTGFTQAAGAMSMAFVEQYSFYEAVYEYQEAVG